MWRTVVRPWHDPHASSISMRIHFSTAASGRHRWATPLMAQFLPASAGDVYQSYPMNGMPRPTAPACACHSCTQAVLRVGVDDALDASRRREPVYVRERATLPGCRAAADGRHHRFGNAAEHYAARYRDHSARPGRSLATPMISDNEVATSRSASGTICVSSASNQS